MLFCQTVKRVVDDASARNAVHEDAVVVRGGVMRTEDMVRNAEEHFHNPHTPDEWALSVASLPGVTHEEIAAEADQVTQRKYRVARAGDILAAGFSVVEDNPPHALILLEDVPDDETCERLRTLFTDEFMNPHHEERTRR